MAEFLMIRKGDEIQRRPVVCVSHLTIKSIASQIEHIATLVHVALQVVIPIRRPVFRLRAQDHRPVTVEAVHPAVEIEVGVNVKAIPRVLEPVLYPKLPGSYMIIDDTIDDRPVDRCRSWTRAQEAEGGGIPYPWVII